MRKSVPGLAGFISKWYLCSAAAESGDVLAYIGIGGLLISALLTAIYMLTIVVRAFFPVKDTNFAKISEYRDPNWKMIVPLMVFTVAVVVFGVYSEPFVALFNQVAMGLV